MAFPNISTGVYGFPKARAAEVALSAVRTHVAGTTSLESIVFVCFDRENLDIYASLGCPT